VVLSPSCTRRSAPPARPRLAREAGEQIGEIHFVERLGSGAELRRPFRRRAKLLTGLLLAELVIGGALFGILERRIRLGHFLEALLGLGLLRHVRVILARQDPIAFLDLV